MLNSIFDYDYSGIEGRISEGRRVFNAVAGTGIRKGGLTIGTCNIIFWPVVVPTALFGCELWVLNKISSNLFKITWEKGFNVYNLKTPNSCSSYGLG